MAEGHKRASDADLPAQTLTFSLGTGAPAGAAITPFTGQFSWKPLSAPLAASVSIIVTDNGTPSLSEALHRAAGLATRDLIIF